MGLETLTQERHTPTTIKTMSAKFGVIRTDTIADFKSLDVRSYGRNNPDGLMPWDQGKLDVNAATEEPDLGDEFAFMDM